MGPLSPQEVLHFSKKVLRELDSQQEEGACRAGSVARGKAQGYPSRTSHLGTLRQAGSRAKQESISKGLQTQRRMGVWGGGGVGARTQGWDAGGDSNPLEDGEGLPGPWGMEGTKGCRRNSLSQKQEGSGPTGEW